MLTEFTRRECILTGTSFLSCAAVCLQRWLDLFAHLAYHNVGQIDWSPYLPEVRAAPCVVWAETELDLICHQMVLYSTTRVQSYQYFSVVYSIHTYVCMYIRMYNTGM